MIKFIRKMLGTKEAVPTTEEQPSEKSTKIENEEKFTTDTFFVAPISKHPLEREFDKEFRLETDNKNVIRINQIQPKGFPKKAAEFIPVVGVTMDNREVTAIEFIKGTERSVELRKEPDNQYDKNAIAVFGNWTSNGEAKTGKLGYLPREVASELSGIDEVRATLKMMYTPIYEKNGIGLRVDVWSKAKKRAKVTEKPYKEIKIPRDSVKRNTTGRELEKNGYIDNAIEMYEMNIKGRFDGSFPYERLAMIYRKRKQYNEEIRVLELAVSKFEGLSKVTQRQDYDPKLIKFRERLERAKILASK